MAHNTSGPRNSSDGHCQICEEGTYGDDPQRRSCEDCPAGYFCPAGTESPTANPCPEGAYCPAGVGSPVPCPAGTYGNQSKATAVSDCIPCPRNSFNQLENRTGCLPCGSSSLSEEGATLCSCIGKFRSFQPSDAMCLCIWGHVFDDPSSREREEGDSDSDCRPEVCVLITLTCITFHCTALNILVHSSPDSIISEMDRIWFTRN